MAEGTPLAAWPIFTRASAETTQTGLLAALNVAGLRNEMASIDEHMKQCAKEIKERDERLDGCAKEIKERDERLEGYSAALQELHDVKEELQVTKNKLLLAWEEKLANGTPAATIGRYAEVNVEPFDGNPSKLRAFLFNMSSKLQTEQDIYRGNTQAQLRAYITHLRGKARDQLENYTDEDGSIALATVADLVGILKSAFGDVDEKGTAQRKIVNLKQGSRLLIEFLAEWQALAAKSDFGDAALVYHLKAAIHPNLLRRLAYSPIASSITWQDFVGLVRAADATERSLDSNYHTREAQNNNNNASRNGAAATQTTQQRASPTDPNAMDLSRANLTIAKVDISNIGWTKKDEGRRAVTEDEKTAKKIYCWVNKLCNWCYSKDHKGDICPYAIWNKGKAFYRGKEGKAQS